MTRKPWTTSEDAMLWAHYPRRGSHWAGWAEILPGRSVSSIANRVQKLGVRMEQPERSAAIDADERTTLGVLAWLNEGLAPSQIDETMGLPEGTARAVATEAWRKDRDQ